MIEVRREKRMENRQIKRNDNNNKEMLYQWIPPALLTQSTFLLSFPSWCSPRTRTKRQVIPFQLLLKCSAEENNFRNGWILTNSQNSVMSFTTAPALQEMPTKGEGEEEESCQVAASDYLFPLSQLNLLNISLHVLILCCCHRLDESYWLWCWSCCPAVISWLCHG